MKTLLLCAVISIAVMGAVFFGPRSVHAQSKPSKAPTAEEMKKANEHYQRGDELKKLGNHDEAIREYLAGYELSGATEFLFNIAQSYRASGDKPMAIEYYEKYLELDPNGAGALSARSHIGILQDEIEREQAAAAERARKQKEQEQKRQSEAEAARKAAEVSAKREAEQAARAKVDAAEAERRQTTSTWLRWSGAGTAAAGVITLGVSGYFGRRAQNLSREASDETVMWTEELEQKAADAESAETTMFVLLGAGSAALVGGGVLYYFGHRMANQPSQKERPSSVSVTSAPIRGGAAVFVEGSF